MTQETTADGKTLDYTYDHVTGSVASVTTAAGTTNYQYNALGQLQTVTAANGQTSYQYDGMGKLAQVLLPNGVTQTYHYNTLNQVTLLETKDHAGNLLEQYAYTYDKVGNKQTVTELNGRQVAYTYDELYRLTEEAITDAANGNRTIAYTYDKVGNRLSRHDSVDGITTYVYDANDRLVSETTAGSTKTSTYDNNGNLLQVQSPDQLTTYTWDTENHLLAANTGTHQLQYQYNADGVRVAATVDGQETRYLVDANRPYAQVLEEYNATGTQVSYVYGQSLLSQTRSGDSAFYLYDGHSGVRHLSDETGAVTDSYTYDAYGKTLQAAGSTQNNYLYRGEQSDPTLGMQYLRARYYDQNLGRFASTDPLEGVVEAPISQHRYLYGNNNPILFSDSSGASPFLDLIIGNLLEGILVGGAFSLGYAIGSHILQRVSGSVTWKGVGGFLGVTLPVESKTVLSSYEPGITGIYLESEPFDGMKTRGSWIIPALGFNLVDFNRTSPLSPPDLSFGFQVSQVQVSSPKSVGIEAGVLGGPFGNLGITLTLPGSLPAGGGWSALNMGYGVGYCRAISF